MSNNHTPHIKADLGDFAKTVLMPGDPIRSKFVADNFLEDPRLVNNVRGVQGYTGTYKGVPVSVMASGMGMPSIGIYSYELFSKFGVENIIRIGSCGALADDVKLGDIIIGMGASCDSKFADQYELGGTFAPLASYDLVELAVSEAKAIGANYKVGNILSSDIFYNVKEGYNLKWKKMGILGVEMEAAALYMNAAYLGKRALAICSVSDHIISGEALDSDARVTNFTDMMKVALETAIKIQSL